MNDINRQYPFLAQVNTPHDLRALLVDKLHILAGELRQYIIDTLNTCGGHFAGNLGTVELNIALHYVFNTPDGRLDWDVGQRRNFLLKKRKIWNNY